MHDQTFLLRQLQQLSQPEPDARLSEKILVHVYLTMKCERFFSRAVCVAGKVPN